MSRVVVDPALSPSDEDEDEDESSSCYYSARQDERSPLTSQSHGYNTSSSDKYKCCAAISGWLFLTTIICIFGSSFQFGYNISVVNAPEQVIKDYFNTHHNDTMTDLLWSMTVSITAVGGCVGAFLGPVAADLYGRKRILLCNNGIIVVGCILMFLSREAKYVSLLIIGRFIVGINNGIATVVVSLYLSEISPTHLRGAIGTLNQFGIVTGILFGYILGLKQVLGTSSLWGYLMSFSIIPAVLQVLILPFCPASPRYLLIKLNKESLARQELRKLQGSYNIEEIIAEMKLEKERLSRENTWTIWQLLTSRSLRWPLILSCVMQVSQQFSGMNGVLYYSTSTFKKANISDPDVASCGIGIVSVIMVGIVVVIVDRWGRRTLMLTGLGGMFIFYGLMTVGFALQDKHDGMKYLSLVCTFFLIACFQIGPGPIPWFIMGELFAQGPRPAATSISGGVNWFTSFLVALTFPTFQSWLFPYVFLLFMGLILALWIFIYLFVPETKGKTFEEITEELHKHPAKRWK